MEPPVQGPPAPNIPPPPPPPGPQMPFSPPSPPTPPRGSRLRRSRTDRMLGGVAGGIAQTYGWDATLVRLAFVGAALLGFGIPAYVVAWIVIPPEDGDGEPERRETSAIIGLLLLGIGVLWLGGRLLPDGHRVVDVVWALALIGGGLFVLVMRSNRKQHEAHDAAFAYGPPVPPPAPEPVPETPPTPSDVFVPAGAPPLLADAPAAAPTEPVPDAPPMPSATTDSAWAQRTPWPYWPTEPARPPRVHHHHPKHRSFLTPLTLSILLIGAGVAALLDATGAMDVDPVAVGAIGLGVIGVALIVSAWVGRAHALVPIGVVLTILLTIGTIVDVPFTGGVGERRYHPTVAGDIDAEKHLAMGEMTLDLRDAPFPEGTTEMEATVAMGELIVQVPNDVRVVVHAEAGAGRIEVFGIEDDGFSPEVDATATATGGRTLELDLRVGMGEIDVTRFTSDGSSVVEGGR